MMMPANYSAVAENEVIYGGASIADYLPQAWDASNVRTLSTNVLTFVSNYFTNVLVNATLGTMFGGNWGKDGVKLFGNEGTVSNLFKYQRTAAGAPDSALGEMSALNKVMTVLGVAASVYTLGNNNAKEYVKNTVVGIDGKKVV